MILDWQQMTLPTFAGRRYRPLLVRFEEAVFQLRRCIINTALISDPSLLFTGFIA